MKRKLSDKLKSKVHQLINKYPIHKVVNCLFIAFDITIKENTIIIESRFEDVHNFKLELLVLNENWKSKEQCLFVAYFVHWFGEELSTFITLPLEMLYDFIWEGIFYSIYEMEKTGNIIMVHDNVSMKRLEPLPPVENEKIN